MLLVIGLILSVFYSMFADAMYMSSWQPPLSLDPDIEAWRAFWYAERQSAYFLPILFVFPAIIIGIYLVVTPRSLPKSKVID